jgi:hypothetical protein
LRGKIKEKNNDQSDFIHFNVHQISFMTHFKDAFDYDPQPVSKRKTMKVFGNYPENAVHVGVHQLYRR